jgi:hypothetical protein
MTAAAITRGDDWQETLEAAIHEAGIESTQSDTADLALFFASADYGEHL